MILTDYMIADCSRKRCSLLQKRINIYRSSNCIGTYKNEVEFLEKTWLERPSFVLVYVGDKKLNAFSILKRIKTVASDTEVVFFSENIGYAKEAYDSGADYFLPLPADDIQIGRLVFRYIGSN